MTIKTILVSPELHALLTNQSEEAVEEMARAGNRATKQVAVDSDIEDRHYSTIKMLRELLEESGDGRHAVGIRMQNLLQQLYDLPLGQRLTLQIKRELILPLHEEAGRFRGGRVTEQIRALVNQLPTQPGLPNNLAEDKLIAIRAQVQHWDRGADPKKTMKAIKMILDLKEVKADGAEEEG